MLTRGARVFDMTTGDDVMDENSHKLETRPKASTERACMQQQRQRLELEECARRSRRFFCGFYETSGISTCPLNPCTARTTTGTKNEDRQNPCPE